jgi:rieske iron-sulfur protein
MRDSHELLDGGEAQSFIDAGKDAENRRIFLKLVIATGAAALSGPVQAVEKEPKDLRPQAGDRFVHAYGDRQGAVIKPEDLAPGGPPILAWPVDSNTNTVRDGSLLNHVLLVRIGETDVDETTRARSANGIVGYSGICTHAQCPVTGWSDERKIFHCPCHQSEFDPRREGKVVSGPAPRPLANLPLKIADGMLVVADTFRGRVGARTM